MTFNVYCKEKKQDSKGQVKQNPFFCIIIGIIYFDCC